jgi:hypothetical protein
MSKPPTQLERELLHMPVEGNEWEQWRAKIWNQMSDRFGYPGLAPLEQWMRRSRKEKRCIECGETGGVRQESIIVAAVDHYWLCVECDRWLREKHHQ